MQCTLLCFLKVVIYSDNSQDESAILTKFKVIFFSAYYSIYSTFPIPPLLPKTIGFCDKDIIDRLHNLIISRPVGNAHAQWIKFSNDMRRWSYFPLDNCYWLVNYPMQCSVFCCLLLNMTLFSIKESIVLFLLLLFIFSTWKPGIGNIDVTLSVVSSS